MLLTDIWETCSIDEKHKTEAYTYWRECDHCG